MTCSLSAWPGGGSMLCFLRFLHTLLHPLYWRCEKVKEWEIRLRWVLFESFFFAELLNERPYHLEQGDWVFFFFLWLICLFYPAWFVCFILHEISPPLCNSPTISITQLTWPLRWGRSELGWVYFNCLANAEMASDIFWEWPHDEGDNQFESFNTMPANPHHPCVMRSVWFTLIDYRLKSINQCIPVW